MSTFITPYTTPGNYTIDTGIEVTGGNAQLIQDTLVTGLVANWRLNDKVEDVGPNANHGIAQNGADTVADATMPSNFTTQRAGNFDNVDDYVHVADDPTLTFGNGVTDSPFSVSAWINPNADVSFPIIVKNNDAANGEWEFIISGSALYFLLWDADVNNIIYQSSAISPSGWTHVVATYDGSGTTAGIKLYENGALMSMTSGSVGTYNSMNDETATVKIGYIPRQTAYADGKIAEVAVYDIELPATGAGSTVATLYGSGNGYVHTGSETSLVSAWHLDETSWLIQDQTTGANHGTAKSGVLYDANGKINSALSFDGVDDYVDIPDFTYASANIFSASVWVNSPAGVNLAYFGHYDAASQIAWVIDSTGTGKVRLILSSDGSTIDKDWTSSITAFDNTYHQITITFNTGTLKLYIDGVEDTSITKTADNAISTVHNSTAAITIGAVLNTGVPFAFGSGIIDEASIWSRELSAAEVLDYATGKEIKEYPSDQPGIFFTALYTDNFLISLDGFTETLGAGNQGTVKHQLSTDGINWKYYTTSWVPAGATDGNTVSVVNTNINSFGTGPTIVSRSILVSDGTQKVVLDEITIIYTNNVNPTVYAGTDKSVTQGVSSAVNSDGTFSDTAPGTVVKVEKQIEKPLGTVQTAYVDIPIGGYGSLLEAFNASLHTPTENGIEFVRIRVTDDQGAQNPVEDVDSVLQLTVADLPAITNMKVQTDIVADREVRFDRNASILASGTVTINVDVNGARAIIRAHDLLTNVQVGGEVMNASPVNFSAGVAKSIISMNGGTAPEFIQATDRKLYFKFSLSEGTPTVSGDTESPFFVGNIFFEEVLVDVLVEDEISV